MTESSPLLPSERSGSAGHRAIALLGALVALGLVTLVALHTSPSHVAMLSKSPQAASRWGDGVQPVNDLSFVQAEKAHFRAVKKLDDVASRAAINNYFDSLSATQLAAHKAAEKQAASSQLSLNKYFDTLQEKYQKEATSHAEMRKERHPGKLMKNLIPAHELNVRKSIDADREAVNQAVDQGLTGESAVKAETASSQATSDSSHSGEKVAMSLAGGNKVQIGFYMESMCPGCKYFTNHVLKKLMDKPEFVSMVDLKVYPYGNGRLDGENIACQHGADECEGNRIIACMQKTYSLSDFVSVFTCMEGGEGLPKAEAENCAKKQNLDYTAIATCANGDEGQKLALEAAQATESLVPAHEYAPWITMNGSPLRDKAYDLQSVVCEAFSGPKPGLCSSGNLKVATSQALKRITQIGFEVCPKRRGDI